MNSQANPTSSRDQFDRQAEMYAISPVHRAGASLPVLVEYAVARPGEQALDIATGTGNTAFAIAECGADVVGLDVSARMLAQAQARAEAEGKTNIRFQEGDAEALPFPDATFDLVTARHAPHHFRNVAKFLSEVRRVLRPGGRFVMADGICHEPATLDWFDRWQRLRDPSHFYARTVEQWKELAQDAGFVWARHTTVGYRMTFDWWVRQSGASQEAIVQLKEHAASASPEIREAFKLEFEDGEVYAFTETMMIVRLNLEPR